MNVTKQLADFASGIQYEDLPEAVIERLKLVTLNIIGKALAGSETTLAAKYLALAKTMGAGMPVSSVMSTDTKLSCPAATYVNSSFATALDYDDTLHWALIHPGNAAVSAGLAVGEMQKSSGREFLTAVVLGYEIGGRIALAAQPTVERFHQVWGLGNQSFTAAPVAGRLLNLDADHMLSAIGITGVYSVVPSAWKYLGPGTRPMREVKMAWGWSAMVGVTSAIAAESGLQMLQSSNILDGDEGWYILHGADKCEPEKMVEGLGTRWDILTTAFKAYSACYLIFGVCDAAKIALAGKQLAEKDISKIVVRGGEWITKRLSDPAPAGPVDAQFSTQWCVSMIVLGLPPGPEWCSEETLSNKTAQQLSNKVELEFDPAADEAWLETGKSLNTVDIHLNSGEVLSGSVDEPKGEPGNPFTSDEIKETFTRLAGNKLSSAQVYEVIEVVDKLESLDDIGDLIGLVAK